MFSNPSMTLETHGADQTLRLGQILGRTLKGGLLIRLDGDLGSGKTCLVQGLARGLGVPGDYDITSPTYTLVHEYEGRLPLVHVDLYRLRDSRDAESIGLWELLDAGAVVAVEWAERIETDLWPEPNLHIRMAALDETSREITLNGCGLGRDNLLNEVAATFLNYFPGGSK